MTDYRIIHGIKKRSFSVQASLPAISTTEVTIDESGLPILWDDGTDIQWDDGSQILWSMNANIYPRSILGVRKRSFVINAKTNHE